METSSSIKPLFIKLVGDRVVIATSPMEDKLDAWIEQT
jgi:hypothetical protein